MFQTLRNAWKIEDLRKKLLFTLLILVIVRLGCAIPVPFLDPSRLQEMLDSTQGNLLGYLNLLTGGAFAEATLFALGVSPYITASIVIQLLTVAIPSLERMAKEGPDGQKKLKKITRYSTIGLAVLQAYAYYTLLRSSQFNAVKYTSGAAGWISGIAIVLAFSAGAMLVVWLGERIDEKGIGNGISLILFAGIVARIPSLITRLIGYIKLGEFFPRYYVLVPLVVMLCVTFTALVERCIALVKAYNAGTAVFMVEGLQLIIAVLLMVLGVIIVVHSGKVLFSKSTASKTENDKRSEMNKPAHC